MAAWERENRLLLSYGDHYVSDANLRCGLHDGCCLRRPPELVQELDELLCVALSPGGVGEEVEVDGGAATGGLELPFQVKEEPRHVQLLEDLVLEGVVDGRLKPKNLFLTIPPMILFMTPPTWQAKACER